MKLRFLLVVVPLLFLFGCGIPFNIPAVGPDGNITYLGVDNDGNGHLFLYDRVEDVTYPLLDDVLSYRPARDGESLWVIKKSAEGNLSLGHLLDYDPKSGDSYEIASFFIGAGVEQMFQTVSYTHLTLPTICSV